MATENRPLSSYHVDEVSLTSHYYTFIATLLIFSSPLTSALLHFQYASVLFSFLICSLCRRRDI